MKLPYTIDDILGQSDIPEAIDLPEMVDTPSFQDVGGDFQSGQYVGGQANFQDVKLGGVVGSFSFTEGQLANIGIINDFSNFLSTVTGTGVTTKSLRYSKLTTGSTSLSTASLSQDFGLTAGYSGRINLDWKIYLDENFDDNVEGYLRFGGVTVTPDTGNTSTKRCGFVLSSPAGSYTYTVSGFVGNQFGITTLSLKTGIEPTNTLLLSIKADASAGVWNFYINKILVGTINKTNMTPWGTTNKLVHAVRNNTAFPCDSVVNQIAYEFDDN